MGLYGFAYTRTALAYLDSLSVKHRRQIGAKVASLAGDPFAKGCTKVQGVDYGGQPVWRVRSGVYRIVYVVANPTITVLRIGHRKDVYKGL